jgi:hypothetical protein
MQYLQLKLLFSVEREEARGSSRMCSIGTRRVPTLLLLRKHSADAPAIRIFW